MDGNYDDIDSLEEEESEQLLDNSPDDSQVVYSDGGYSQVPEKTPKFGQEEYERKQGNNDYYKDKQKELDSEKPESERIKREKNAKKDELKSNKKDAKANKKEDGGKEAYKAAKDDYKEAKSEAKDAKRDYRQARRKSFNNKLDNAKSQAYQMAHPVEALKSRLKNKYDPVQKIKNKINNTKDAIKDKAKQTAKKGAKAAGKAAKKGAKAVGKATVSLLSKIPPQVWLIIAGVVAVFAAIVVVVVVVMGVAASFDSSGITAASVDYNVNGVNAETQVKITKENGELLATVPLEKYIAGAALLQVGKDYEPEVLKTQIIMIRSYLLAKGVKDPSNNYIYVTNSDKELVYWDYMTNLFRTESDTAPGTYIYSPEYVPEDASVAPYMSALTMDEITAFETIVASVMGQYVVDSSGNPVSRLNKDDITILNEMATQNEGTDNGSYTALLQKNYSEISKTETAEYEMIYYGESGEFSTWKQKTKLGAPWGNVLLGTSATIDDVGCLVTSISMQIAYSGVKTGNITDFNPGTFATAARKQGCFSSGGAINSYACLQKVVPNFQYGGAVALSGSNQERYNIIKNYAQKGYFIVIEVRKHGGGQHWVALDVVNSAAVSWKDIYMWDPATTKTKISDKISYKANKIIYFKAIK